MHNHKKINILSGFGLIELMVSISILVLVISIIVSRHDSYNGAVLLRSQAYDIALKIREVQMQAVSVVDQGNDFRTPLGVCFNTTTPNYYYVFADTDDDGKCDSNEYVGQRGNIDPRFEITTLNLLSDGSEESVGELAILFERPNFDARFFVGTGSNNERTDVESVEIGLVRVGAGEGDGPGDLRVMEISRTGQILVQPVNGNNGGSTCERGDPNCDETPPVDCEKTGTCNDQDPPDCTGKDCETSGDETKDGGDGTIELPENPNKEM